MRIGLRTLQTIIKYVECRMGPKSVSSEPEEPPTQTTEQVSPSFDCVCNCRGARQTVTLFPRAPRDEQALHFADRSSIDCKNLLLLDAA